MEKTTGIVRGLDELGRLTLPIEIRRTLNFNPRQPLEILVDGENIIVRKYQIGCKMCGRIGNLKSVNGVSFCKDCAEEIIKKFKEDTY